MDEANSEWIKIYSSAQLHKVHIVKAVLEDHQVQSFEVNKKDSSYLLMGEIDLYVHINDAVLATFLIKSNEL